MKKILILVVLLLGSPVFAQNLWDNQNNLWGNQSNQNRQSHFVQQQQMQRLIEQERQEQQRLRESQQRMDNLRQPIFNNKPMRF